jgi:hypothetical protein
MSTTGVPSIASSGPTFNSRPTISSTVTGCEPSGFGRSGDRVAKTPVSGALVSPRGCVFRTSRKLVQPGDDDQLVAGFDPIEPVLHRRHELDPRVGCSFAALIRCSVAGLER